MVASKQIVSALKKTLKSKGITYKELGARLRLSEPTIKRIFSQEDFSLSRLEKICEAADLDFFEWMQTALASKSVSRQELTFAQEEFLSKHSDAFTFFHLLLQGETPKGICEKYSLSELKKTKISLELEKNGLIELHPGGRIKLLVSRSIRWSISGPLMKKYGLRVRNQFFDSTFNRPDEYLRLISIRLSQATQTIIQRKIRQLIREVEEMCNLEENTEDLPETSFNLFLAYRSMKFKVSFRD